MNIQPANLRIYLITTPIAHQKWRTTLNGVGSTFVISDQASALTVAHPQFMSAQFDIVLIDIDHLLAEADKNLPALRLANPSLPFAAVAQKHHRGLLDFLYRSGMRGYLTNEIGVAAFGETLASIVANPDAFIVRIGG